MSRPHDRGYDGGVSVPESRPPRLTDAERRQLDDLEQRLLGQFPDLGGRFARTEAAEPTPREVRLARLVFAVLGALLVVFAGVVGGLGAAAAVLVAVAGTFGLLAVVGRNLARARAAVEATTARRTSPTGPAEA
ncbi:Protein of unknown function [Pseudonocardia oroxyli]|uniref:DUF3040 domain-containing protein n=1 Tax=Pseudonocardia oroxyli TaxID=366584 RepID=A0A1G7DXC4_PSEOR|nr:Protein of unknown function [Pseudonocardia oroxyli]